MGDRQGWRARCETLEEALGITQAQLKDALEQRDALKRELHDSGVNQRMFLDLTVRRRRYIDALKQAVVKQTKSRDDWKRVAESLEWQLKREIAVHQECN